MVQLVFKAEVGLDFIGTDCTADWSVSSRTPAWRYVKWSYTIEVEAKILASMSRLISNVFASRSKPKPRPKLLSPDRDQDQSGLKTLTSLTRGLAGAGCSSLL